MAFNPFEIEPGFSGPIGPATLKTLAFVPKFLEPEASSVSNGFNISKSPIVPISKTVTPPPAPVSAPVATSPVLANDSFRAGGAFALPILSALAPTVTPSPPLTASRADQPPAIVSGPSTPYNQNGGFRTGLSGYILPVKIPDVIPPAPRVSNPLVTDLTSEQSQTETQSPSIVEVLNLPKQTAPAPIQSDSVLASNSRAPIASQVDPIVALFGLGAIIVVLQIRKG